MSRWVPLTTLERSCKSCRSTRFYVKEMYSRILFTFGTIFSVIKTEHSNHFASVEEKPNITSFRRLENTSAHYDAKVTLECKASGIPRPQVTLLVNALKANKIDSGHSIMAPYITTVTFKLKMTSEVECQVSNRMGIDFLRTRIEMKGSLFHCVEEGKKNTLFYVAFQSSETSFQKPLWKGTVL